MNPRETLVALAELARNDAELVPSPCVSVCRMDVDAGLCSGCFRTIEEIVAWGRMAEPHKRVVWQHIAQRASLEQP